MQNKLICPVLIRYMPGKNDEERGIVIFLPSVPANAGYMVSYMRQGQHGEASMAYFAKTLPLRFTAEVDDLRREYRAICEANGERMVVYPRDTQAFQRQRWGWKKQAGEK